ncbi:MAG: hypothetical protein ABIL01_29060 [Pseudomonadota bacterium]
MFSNVPKHLTDYLRDAAADFDRESFYYFAAAYLSLYYLKKNFTDEKTSDFLNIRTTVRGGIWWGHSGRVIIIGETLFLMRSAPGFDEFCRRLCGRDLRSTYFEVYAARMFFEGGYEVGARPEAGVRGEDFDFYATRNGETVNVEVTALTPETFSIQTVENALQHKRKQLPDTDPAVIFCILPESWSETPMGVALGNLTKKFFVKTRRISAVVYVIEKHVEWEKDGKVGHLSMQHICLVNPNPRRPIGSLSFFNFDAWNVAPTAPPTQRRDNEFFQWADSLFMTKNDTK